MNSTPLVVPFTFPNVQRVINDEAPFGSRALVDESCSSSRAVSLTSWGSSVLSQSTAYSGSDLTRGIAIGCDDGSLFLFQRPVDHLSLDASLESRDPTPILSRPSSPLKQGHSGRSRSRSRTPSSLSSFSPLNITSRSRIVSGLTTDQVEAPKNYVDFDEEPEKLKELLKGGVRETTVTDRLSLPSFDKGLTIEKSPHTTSTPSSLATSRRENTNAIPSPSHLSPSATPKSLSVASSPTLRPSAPLPPLYGFRLGQHVFPPMFGHGCSTSALQPLNSGRHVLSLQANGYSIFNGVVKSCTEPYL